MSDYYLQGAHRDESDPVWHQSSEAVYYGKDEVITIIEAMRRANMDDVLVETIPLEAVFAGGNVSVPDRFALGIKNPSWQDTPVFFNRVVGNRYVPMQNARLAELLEGLNDHWPLEGTMMLKKGEVTVVQLKIDEYAVGDREEEKHLAYLVVAIDYTQGGIMWLRTDVRVVCWNTYSWSLEAIDKMRIPNSENADDTLGFLAKVQELTVEEQKKHLADMNALFTRKVTPEEGAIIVDAAFPDPKESSRMKIAQLGAAQLVEGELATNFFKLVDDDQANYEWNESRTAKQRLAVGAEIARFNDNHSYASNTAYAYFQGVTATINHSDIFTGGKDKRAISYILGNQKKKQNDALNAALGLVGRGKKKKSRRK